jgi:hypothetical protein
MTRSEDPATVVAEFYTTLAGGQPDDVADMVVRYFAKDATLARPESLPGGGTVHGAVKIAKFMRLAASQAKGLRLSQLHAAVNGEAVHVFAVVELDVGKPTSAIEWWVFDTRGVKSLTAYYWDTAALITP